MAADDDSFHFLSLPDEYGTTVVYVIAMDEAGDSVSDTLVVDIAPVNDAPVFVGQDSLFVLISLLGMICGTMFARRGGLMSLNDLLKLTGGKHSIKGGQTRTLRIGMGEV